jgi:hypothetical protein
LHVNDLLKIAVEGGASDLHLKVGSFPMMRIRGMLVAANDEKKLDHEDVVAMAAAVMSTTQRQKFKESQEVDLAYSVPGLGRFRCNIFQQRGTVGLVLRVIPMQIRTIDELGLPTVLKSIASEERGLVLVTGTTGSGKSTTLAALVQHALGARPRITIALAIAILALMLVTYIPAICRPASPGFQSSYSRGKSHPSSLLAQQQECLHGAHAHFALRHSLRQQTDALPNKGKRLKLAARMPSETACRGADRSPCTSSTRSARRDPTASGPSRGGAARRGGSGRRP